MGEDEDKEDVKGVLCSERLWSSMLVPSGASSWFGRPAKGEEIGVDASMTRMRCGGRSATFHPKHAVADTNEAE